MKKNCQICATPPAFPLRGASFSRRGFLQLTGLGLAGWFAGDGFSESLLANASAVSPKLRGTARNCALIFLAGAPSQTDLWDLKEGSWTPAKLAPTSYGDVRWPQGLLAKTSEHLGKLAIVRSGLAWVAVHPLAQRWAQISRNPAGVLGNVAPHIGSVIALETASSRRADDVLPSFIALDPAHANAGYFSANHAPLTVRIRGNVGGLPTISHRDGADRLAQRLELLEQLDPDRGSGALAKGANDFAALYESAWKMSKSPDVANYFTVGQSDYTRYGSTRFGSQLIVTKQLLAANRGTRFVQATSIGWDDHNDIYDKFIPRVTAFDNAFAPFLSDLASTPGSTEGKSLLDETLVVVYAEFGRTLGPLNSQKGRDHHQRMSVVFAGGGTRAQVLGRTSALGDQATEFGWSANRDVRAEDVTATIYSALGIDYTTIRKDDPLGRGFEYVPYAREGLYEPVDELFV